MLVVCCVNAGNYCGRGKEYVEILHDMVGRNISDKEIYRFVCFTDDLEPYEEGIEKKPLHDALEGWWHKLYLFKKGHFYPGDTVLYLDLDTCIVSGLDHFLTYKGGLCLLRDVYRPDGLQSSVMLWTGDQSYLWEEYVKQGFPQTDPGGDQAWLESQVSNCEILQTKFPYQFVSYKRRAQFEIPAHAKIVFFHGLPRPHQCEGWVPHVWKIGGGSVLELEVIANTNDAEIEKNIRHACSLPLENLADQYMRPHDNVVSIVGGGPSLADDLDEIRWRQMNGEIIWSLNNTFKYLKKNGIAPDAHLMLDARLANKEFVPCDSYATKLYASQCHAEVLAQAIEGPGHVILWHDYSPIALKVINELGRKVAFIGAGSSVGLKALTLAQLFGFKTIHLYGYDSCYRDAENHAYRQDLNKFERIIEVIQDNQKFKCAPWMATQANEFKQCIPNFLGDGLTIAVHGQGLIPYIASKMVNHD